MTAPAPPASWWEESPAEAGRADRQYWERDDDPTDTDDETA
ncbi:hypothetical protein [Streptomyces sp. H27-D2]|nr:hypothetical protein [Streptomyces sp. H27-D2]MEC4016048.1 hypothetical protein [Streptomyces sp. H27-D2]